MNKRVLLIHPWIYDFAAFDLWARPVGLLYIAGVLRSAGYCVDYIDCLDRFHPVVQDSCVKRGSFEYGCGNYYAEEVEKPEPIKWVQRKYSRYGMPLDLFASLLESASKPDAVLISSRMTYWYPGVELAVDLVRKHFPNVPVILGGTYASLCEAHAKRVCKPDLLVTGEGEGSILPILAELLQHSLSDLEMQTDLDDLPYPAYDLLSNQSALCVLTSRGCPMNCFYCSSKKLFPEFRQRNVANVVKEIEFYVREYHTQDIAFIDDALLVNRQLHIEPILDGLIERNVNVRFHTPNGLHCAMIDERFARKMYRAGFKTIRLSLETANPERLQSLNRQATNEDFLNAVDSLKSAGFSPDQIGVYVMIGLPGQSEQEVKESLDFVFESGVTPKLTEYSPIPHTSIWNDAVANARRPIADEPLLHNNTVYHLISQSLDPGAYNRLKVYIRERMF